MESLLFRLDSEVRHSLHHILGLMEMVCDEPLSDTQSRYLDRTRESADRLLRIADDLTELARPGVFSRRISPFSAAQAINEVAEIMSVLANRKGLRFEWSVDASVPTAVVGDKDLFQNTLQRLVDNAIRLTEEGKVCLEASASPLEEGRSRLDIRIADSSGGIPPEALVDLECTVSGLQIQQGLDLRVVKKRVEDSGGELDLRSSSDGAVVDIKLPVVLASVVLDDSTTRTASPGSPAPMNILVAEDSNDSFLLLQAYTKADGHRLSRAVNGSEAVAMAKSGDFNLIVMDVNMPEMDGYTATRTIREWETEEGRTRTPIVLLSADDIRRQVRIGGAAGCSGYLPKPTSKAQVLEALSFYAPPVPA